MAAAVVRRTTWTLFSFGDNCSGRTEGNAMALPQYQFDDASPLTPDDLPSYSEMERLFSGTDAHVFRSAFAPGADRAPVPSRRLAVTEEDEILAAAFR
jgi:hypothetical protein